MKFDSPDLKIKVELIEQNKSLLLEETWITVYLPPDNITVKSRLVRCHRDCLNGWWIPHCNCMLLQGIHNFL